MQQPDICDYCQTGYTQNSLTAEQTWLCIINCVNRHSVGEKAADGCMALDGTLSHSLCVCLVNYWVSNTLLSLTEKKSISNLFKLLRGFSCKLAARTGLAGSLAAGRSKVYYSSKASGQAAVSVISII